MSSTNLRFSNDDLERFVVAQAPVSASVLGELIAGAKLTHWMWFVFPQLRALGYSDMAKFYGLADLAQAIAYRAHPILGARLIENCEAMRPHVDAGAISVLGNVDAMKWRSCLTLFAATPDAPPLFTELIAEFYDRQPDERTLQLLARG